MHVSNQFETHSTLCQVFEADIAASLVLFARELRLVELQDYKGYVLTDKPRCLSEIIDSAAEPYFAPGFVTMQSVTVLNEQWGETAKVRVILSINGAVMKSFVELTLHDTVADIRLVHCDVRQPAVPFDEALLFSAGELKRNSFSASSPPAEIGIGC